MKYNKWTNEETKWLKENFPLTNINECQNYLKRGYDSVRMKACQLGLTRNDGPKPFTEEELKLIKDNLTEEGIKECSKILNRSWGSIYDRAKKFGYKSNYHIWTKKEEDFLKENYSEKGAKWCSNELGLLLSLVIYKCSRLKLKRPISNIRGSKSHGWTGYGEIPGTFFCSVRRGAKSRNLELNITLEQMWDLFLKQNRCCAFSGIELRFQSKDLAFDGTASLDRIDSSKGYTIDNVQWVHKDLNKMKLAMTDEKFINWCHMISDYQRKSVKVPLHLP